MTAIFQRTDDGIVMRLHLAELDLLSALRDGLTETLASPEATNPVIERLFPAAVDGDKSADQELRRLMRGDLLEQRREALDTLTAIFARTTPAADDDRRADDNEDGVNYTRVTLLSDEEAHLLLTVLNDLRLAIAAQLRPDVLARDQAPADKATQYRLDVMDHLAWMQHHLLVVLDPDLAIDDEDMA